MIAQMASLSKSGNDPMRCAMTDQLLPFACHQFKRQQKCLWEPKEEALRTGIDCTKRRIFHSRNLLIQQSRELSFFAGTIRGQA